MRRINGLLVVAVVSVAACVAWLVPLEDELTLSVWVARVAVCAAFAAAAVLTAARRPGTALPALMLLFALLYAGGSAVEEIVLPWRYTAGLALADLELAVLACIVLAFPSGRLPGWPSRALVLAVGAVTLGWKPFELLYDAPAALCATCPPAGNLFFTGSAPFDFAAVSDAVQAARDVLVASLVALLAAQLWRASPAARAVLVPVAVPTIAFAAKYVADDMWLENDVVWPGDRFLLFEAPNAALLASIAVGLLVGVSRASGWHGRVGGLLVALDGRPAGSLRDHLARALSDTSLEVGYWADRFERFVSDAGSPVELPAPGSERAATLVEGRDGPLAVLIHDPALLAQAGLLESVTAAARLALENERLQAEVRAQLTEVVRSRARIVEAADDERRRIERDLHDGAQQRLVGLRVALRSLRSRAHAGGDLAELDAAIDVLDSQAKSAIASLRDLARGIHPAILTEEGLAAALEALADDAPIAVSIGELPAHRLPPSIEAAAYFACSEAIVNAAKHAGADTVSLAAREEPGLLRVTVRDDGRGGARMDDGSGLRGLSDRVEALGGHLAITSAASSGTTVEATIPLRGTQGRP